MGKFKSMAIVALVTLMTSAGARAESITMSAGASLDSPSSFTLDFGTDLGRSTGHISFMDIELEVDPDSGTARFVRYYQEVEALTLPGGLSTGAMVIEIVEGSSSGTYNEMTGIVDTVDEYAIYFDGDLSAFGLQSPVILPSTSLGTVVASAVTGGTITLDWAGFGQLANPFDPNNPLTFEYTCSTNATFESDAYTTVRIGLLPSVLGLRIPAANESRLIRDLDTVLSYLNRGYDSLGAYWLQRFANDVDAMSPNPISANIANQLIQARNYQLNPFLHTEPADKSEQRRPLLQLDITLCHKLFLA